MNSRIAIPRLAALITTIFAIPAAATAHDSWLVANTHKIIDGGIVKLSFMTGETFPVGQAPTDPDRVAEFNQLFGARNVVVGGYAAEGNALVASPALTGPGFHLVACVLKPRLITLDSAKFDDYLTEERAEEALAARRESKGNTSPVTEQFTKIAKTYVLVGDPDPKDKSYSVPMGEKLEIIPLTNPTAWQSGATARVRVLLDGYPWPGVAVSAGHENADKDVYAIRGKTDANGEASIAINASGRWFIKAYLIRQTNPLAPFSWESYWSTFTFDAGGLMAGTDLTPDVRSVVAIHGELSPWAALGYRMGKRALKELGMEPGDRRLLAIHRTPFEQPYSIIADGIQSATGATIGKLSLLIGKVNLQDMRSEFLNQANGQSATCRPKPAILSDLAAARTTEAAEALAMRILVLPEPELFDVSRGSFNVKPPPPTSFPTSAAADNEPPAGPVTPADVAPRTDPAPQTEEVVAIRISKIRPAERKCGPVSPTTSVVGSETASKPLGLSEALVRACKSSELLNSELGEDR